MFGSVGEYLPRLGAQTSLDTLHRYEYLAGFRKSGQALSSAKCAVTEPRTTPYEALTLTIRIQCNRATPVALPISVNRFTRVTPHIRVFRVPNDPRLVVHIPSSAPIVLEVRLPTIWRVLF